jgi:hypothetical protein
LRGKQQIEERLNDPVIHSSKDGLSRFKENFSSEIKKGILEAKEDFKRRQNQR